MSPRSLFLPTLVATLCLVTISNVEGNFIDDAVECCRKNANRLASVEHQFTTDSYKYLPQLSQNPLKEFKRIIYEKEKRQRPFECISDFIQSNGYGDKQLNSSVMYRALQNECQLKQSKPKCYPLSKYRTMDGTCNNLQNPTWGSSVGCCQRLLKANYRGVSGMRRSVRRGAVLPHPRTVTLKIFTDKEARTQKNSELFVFFGQMTAHSIGQFITTHVNGEMLDCCENPSGKNQHPQCAPFIIPPDDPFYSKHNVTCFNFVRIAPCDTCSTNKRLPINQINSYLDAGFVHGNSEETANDLRRRDGSGKLRSQNRGGGELLPGIPESKGYCGEEKKQQYCMKAGDNRANQHTPLLMLQTVFFREHNRIAGKLKSMHQTWDDETVYQEARKILSAEFQIIVFNEFLPILLGEKLMKKYELNLRHSGYYNSSVNPSLYVEWNAAAYRLHSIIPGKVLTHGKIKLLRYMFFNAGPVYEDQITQYLSQMMALPTEAYDGHVSEEMTNHVYRELDPNFDYGLDVVAIDIQRGRDAGLPTYTQVLEHFRPNKKGIRYFNELADILETECLNSLKRLYADARDIDLWAGLNCEIVPDDMVVGPTAGEIIASQFRNLKFGDRFYFGYRQHTTKQLETLVNASLARLICDNTGVQMITRSVLRPFGEGNIPQPCSTIPEVNLERF